MAWEIFKTGKMRKADVLEYSSRLEENLFDLSSALTDGKYRHDAYERFYVDDPKRRHISKATVRDRVVHQAVVNAVGHSMERSLIHDSYSSRDGKGTHAAVERLDRFLRQASANGTRRVFALKCDVRKYFDSVRHDLLLEMIRRHVADHRLFVLIETVVRSHSADDAGTRGLPLGNVTSQLFANLYLNGFDHWVKERLGMRSYVRFCDDFVILHEDRQVLEDTIESIRAYLSASLDLQLHPQKVSIRTYVQGADFVGWVLRPSARTIREKTGRRLLNRLRDDVESYRRDEFVGDGFGQAVQSCLGLLKFGDEHLSETELRAEAWRITNVRK